METTVNGRIEFIRRLIMDADNKHRLLSGGEVSMILSDLKAIESAPQLNEKD